MKTLILKTLLSSLIISSAMANDGSKNPSTQPTQPPAKVVVKPEDIYTHLKPMKGAIDGKTSKEIWLKFNGINSCKKGFCAEEIPVIPLKNALNYFKAHSKIINNQDYIAILDFNLNSVKKRLFILDMKTGAVEKMHATHARNSETTLGVAGKFSNVVGGEMSSLGFYLTDTDHYYGRHGISLRLDGLSKTNSNARERAIVIHGADYATEWFIGHKGRLGHSQGCPAVSPKNIEPLIEKMKGQGLLYLHK